MLQEQKRYFIELQGISDVLPRITEQKIRRERAQQFISTLHHWLKQNDLETKVSNLAITALGQVHITCDSDVMHQIRQHEDQHIASIRQGIHFVEGMNRWQNQSAS